jgi:hypothetical protein
VPGRFSGLGGGLRDFVFVLAGGGAFAQLAETLFLATGILGPDPGLLNTRFGRLDGGSPAHDFGLVALGVELEEHIAHFDRCVEIHVPLHDRAADLRADQHLRGWLDRPGRSDGGDDLAAVDGGKHEIVAARPVRHRGVAVPAARAQPRQHQHPD